ncbi:hypothetical protein B484DRAFT_204415, partial [Ochromonadaceae sp. CCMP2298]
SRGVRGVPVPSIDSRFACVSRAGASFERCGCTSEARRRWRAPQSDERLRGEHWTLTLRSTRLPTFSQLKIELWRWFCIVSSECSCSFLSSLQAKNTRARAEGEGQTVGNECGTVGMLHALVSAGFGAECAIGAAFGRRSRRPARAQMISAGEPQEAPANSLRLQPVPQGTASGIRALSCCTNCPGVAVHSNPIFGSRCRC